MQPKMVLPIDFTRHRPYFATALQSMEMLAVSVRNRDALQMMMFAVIIRECFPKLTPHERVKVRLAGTGPARAYFTGICLLGGIDIARAAGTSPHRPPRA